jgi:hypothetical protein
MLSIKNLAILFLLILGVNTSSFAAEQSRVTGKVTRIVTHSSSYNPYSETSRGLTAIYVEGLPKSCGNNGQARVAIGVDHPVHNTVVSMALTAHSTGKKVTLEYLDTCTVRSNSWDFAFMFINEL